MLDVTRVDVLVVVDWPVEDEETGVLLLDATIEDVLVVAV